MKRLKMIVICMVCMLLTLQLYAQSVQPPSLPDGKNLTFGGKFTGAEDSFIFGIIADRAGGNPIIGWPYFEQAIRDMNVLHPDFVFMPGDLIDGYSHKQGPEGVAEDFNEQFDLFTHFANKLEMPLYCVPGNHDLPAQKMIAPYLERFGRLWYSFDYRGVHFIALNTEAKPGDGHNFTEEQVQWAISDIAASKDTRHTVVFMHNPAWHRKRPENLMYCQWLRIEDALRGRKYTVIAGHTHRLSTTIRNGRPYYIMASSGGMQRKPHSFYLGNTHHTALVKIEGDTLHLSILELGATHSIDQVSKTRKPIERIETIRSLQSNGKEFQTEFNACVTNPQPRDILAEFSLHGLSLNGWRSSAGERLTRVISPGDSAIFQTVLSISNPTTSYPPLLNITAKDNGLKLVDHSAEAPIFKKEDYRTILNWHSAAPFEGSPLLYTEPPFDHQRVFPALFKDFGPEAQPWNPDDIFQNGIGWKQIIANKRDLVDFGKMYGYLHKNLAYAISFVDSPDDRLVYVNFIANDFGRIWLNGENVGQDMFFIGDGMKPFPVWLKKGRNTILIKVVNMFYNWNFVLKLTDVDHSLKFH